MDFTIVKSYSKFQKCYVIIGIVLNEFLRFFASCFAFSISAVLNTKTLPVRSLNIFFDFF